MGNIFPDYVNITNVVFVPSAVTNTQELAVDNDLLNRVLRYNRRIFNETRVGWFITKPKIDNEVAILHKHLLPNLKSQTGNWAGPLILLVDPSLKTDKIELNGYVSQPNKMFRDCFAVFRPVKVHVDLFNEKLATAKLLYCVQNKTPEIQEEGEPQNTFEKAFDESKINIAKLKEVLGNMSEEEIAQAPELLKQVKSILALRMDYINDKKAENVDRFVEDNHH
jgi:hypothetical protein